MTIVRKGDKLSEEHKKKISLGVRLSKARNETRLKGVTLPKLPPFKEEDEDGK